MGRPTNGDRWVVVADRTVMSRRIAGVDLVDDLGVRLQRDETVRETNRDQQLVPAIARDFYAGPATEARRALANVDRDIEDRTANDPDQLRLSTWRHLEVKPAQRAGKCRKRVVVLDEGQIDTGLGERPLVPRLGKEAAVVTILRRDDLEHTFKSERSRYDWTFTQRLTPPVSMGRLIRISSVCREFDL